MDLTELYTRIIVEIDPELSLEDTAQEYLLNKIELIQTALNTMIPDNFTDRDQLHDLLDHHFGIGISRVLFNILNREWNLNGYSQAKFINLITCYFLSELIETGSYDDQDEVVIPISKKQLIKGWKKDPELWAYMCRF